MSLRIFLLLHLFASALVASSQNFLSWQYNDRYFSAQFGAGMSSYRGELKHNNSFQNEFSNFSIGLEARLLSKVAARAEIAIYNIRGKDAFAADSSYEKQRNLSFESRNFEASLQGVFYLKRYQGDYYRRWRLDPYVFGGVGFTTLNPKAEVAGIEYELRDLKTEGVSYSQLAMIFPTGIGLKFRLSPFANVITEASYRFTLSDYLDDVSDRYVNPYPNQTLELVSNRKNEIEIINIDAYDNLLIEGGPRGDPSNRDAYLFLSFKLEFFIPPLDGTSPFKKSSAK